MAKAKKAGPKEAITMRSLYLFDRQWKALAELGEKLERDRSYLIRKAIDELLEREKKAK